MGRKKIDTTVEITDRKKRSITITKRKKGLIKKARELSKMCGLNLALVIQDKYNPQSEITTFTSSSDFSLE